MSLTYTENTFLYEEKNWCMPITNNVTNFLNQQGINISTPEVKYKIIKTHTLTPNVTPTLTIYIYIHTNYGWSF